MLVLILNNMTVVCNKLYTKLTNGNLVSFIRHYRPSCRKGFLSYSKKEDTVVAVTPITNPKPMWDNKPFLDYHKEFVGRLSYREYCKKVDEDSIWVFNDFTNCSERMWEEVNRNC